MLEDKYDSGIDLDKSWHAIFYLLTGSAWETTDPVGLLLCGGEPVGEEDVGYGPARLLRPEQVSQLNSILQGIDSDELRRRYDPKALHDADIYPSIWDRIEEYEENFEYIREYYDILRCFISDATTDGMGVIVSIS